MSDNIYTVRPGDYLKVQTIAGNILIEPTEAENYDVTISPVEGRKIGVHHPRIEYRQKVIDALEKELRENGKAVEHYNGDTRHKLTNADIALHRLESQKNTIHWVLKLLNGGLDDEE